MESDYLRLKQSKERSCRPFSFVNNGYEVGGIFHTDILTCCIQKVQAWLETCSKACRGMRFSMRAKGMMILK